MNRTELANFYAFMVRADRFYISWLVVRLQRYSGITSTGNSSKGSRGNIIAVNANTLEVGT
jgi:hypothetical protein